jgi:tetratricopeptide (TPR) repeat protein
MDLWYGSDHPLFKFAQASRYLKKAMNIDKSNSDAYTVLSYLYMMKGDHDQAIAAGMTAVDLNPNGADALSQLGNALHKANRSVEAVNVLKKAIELNPIPPGYYFRTLGNAYGAQGKYEEALPVFEKAIKLEPNDIFSHLGLSVILSLMGRTKEAKAEAKEVLRINPKFSIENMENVSTVKNKDWNERWYNAAKQAGLE